MSRFAQDRAEWSHTPDELPEVLALMDSMGDDAPFAPDVMTADDLDWEYGISDRWVAEALAEQIAFEAADAVGAAGDELVGWW